MLCLFQAPVDCEMLSMIKLFECTEHSADRNSSHWARARRVPSSNPGAEQTDWDSFRGFPQSSRQMMSCMYITTIHLKIHNSQNTCTTVHIGVLKLCRTYYSDLTITNYISNERATQTVCHTSIRARAHALVSPSSVRSASSQYGN